MKRVRRGTPVSSRWSTSRYARSRSASASRSTRSVTVGAGRRWGSVRCDDPGDAADTGVCGAPAGDRRDAAGLDPRWADRAIHRHRLAGRRDRGPRRRAAAGAVAGTARRAAWAARWWGGWCRLPRGATRHEMLRPRSPRSRRSCSPRRASRIRDAAAVAHGWRRRRVVGDLPRRPAPDRLGVRSRRTRSRTTRFREVCPRVSGRPLSVAGSCGWARTWRSCSSTGSTCRSRRPRYADSADRTSSCSAAKSAPQRAFAVEPGRTRRRDHARATRHRARPPSPESRARLARAPRASPRVRAACPRAPARASPAGCRRACSIGATSRPP